MQIYWLALLGAILAEVIATTCLKLSDGMSRTGPSIAMFLGYGVAFALLSFTVTRIELSISYAIWSGLGVVLTMLVGLFFFAER